jgi:hypothetical protein
MRARLRDRPGLVGYPLDALYEEVAYLAYYLHWPRDVLLEMEHEERRRWLVEVSRLNERLNEEGARD